MFIGELGIISDGGIEDGYEMFLDFVKWVVADHVEPFEVVGEEDLEVVVVGLVQSGIDVMVVRAGIAGVLHLEVLHKDKVFYHLHVLYLAVFSEEGPN